MREIIDELSVLLEIISAQANNGLAFTPNPYDVRRYQEILKTIDQIYELFDENQHEISFTLRSRSLITEIGSSEYVTPKVAVSAVVFNPVNEVLLIRRERDLWTLPGGYADVGHDPIKNIKKEVEEETGLSIQVKALIGIYDSNINKFPSIGRQVYLLVFLGNIEGGILMPDTLETKGADFYDLQSLPKILPTNLSQIEYGYRIQMGEILPTIVEHNTE
jgi:ADP-ribose pyrophosphatase YjhB (NUDIX family)